MDNESDKYVLFSTIFGILLTISELLPYIKSIKSNGILEFIFETCFLLLKKYKSNDNIGRGDAFNDRLQGVDRLQNDTSERLLEDFIDSLDRNNNINENNGNKCLTITSENITISFNSPKEIKIS
jgi:hypothetical protein